MATGAATTKAVAVVAVSGNVGMSTSTHSLRWDDRSSLARKKIILTRINVVHE
jgi:hypothetical protein